MIMTCPQCFSADDVTFQRLPDHVFMYTCARLHSAAGSHTWLRSANEVADAHDEAPGGVTDELLDPLSSCVEEGEPFVEYGIVEYRLRQRYPELFRAHVRDRGHILLGPKTYTASSVRFGVALGRLARSGELVSRYGPATGAWSYNGQITYWARPPAPSSSALTWEQFCVDSGRSVQWTNEDRADLA